MAVCISIITAYCSTACPDIFALSCGLNSIPDGLLTIPTRSISELYCCNSADISGRQLNESQFASIVSGHVLWSKIDKIQSLGNWRIYNHKVVMSLIES